MNGMARRGFAQPPEESLIPPPRPDYSSKLTHAGRRGKETCAEPGSCEQPVEVEVVYTETSEDEKLIVTTLGFCTKHGEARQALLDAAA